MIRNFRRSGQEPDLSLMSQGECVPLRSSLSPCPCRAAVAAHGQSERAKAMFAKLGELMEGRTPVRLHAAGQSEEVGTSCGVA
jgi:hypothetical protein